MTSLSRMPDAFRILITGSRIWTDVHFIEQTLHDEVSDLYHDQVHMGPYVFVDGACPTGVDKIAHEWAVRMNHPTERWPAEWNRYGKPAGFRRNEAMVKSNPDLCIAFVKNNSKGAMMTVRLAVNAGIPTKVYRVDE